MDHFLSRKITGVRSEGNLFFFLTQPKEMSSNTVVHKMAKNLRKFNVSGNESGKLIINELRGKKAADRVLGISWILCL